MNLPISVYDFFGYLASGFLLLAAVEFGFDGNWLVEREWKPGVIALYVTLAYVIGHIVASLASHFLEQNLSRKYLGPSEELLLGKEPKARAVCKWLFWSFFKPLSLKTQERILEAAKAEGLTEVNRALYDHAFEIAKQDKTTFDRMNSFLNLYGFCRNISFALLLASLVIAASGVWYAVFIDLKTSDAKKISVGVLCIGGAFMMLYRYLKFYRLYTIEVLRAYPDLKKKNDDKKKDGQ